MITKLRQRQGFGKMILDMLVEYLRTCGYAPLFSPVAPRIALITVWTDEPEPMKRFYRDVLRFPMKSDLGDYIEFESPGVRFGICRRTVMAKHSPEFSRPAKGQAFQLAFPSPDPDGNIHEVFASLA